MSNGIQNKILAVSYPHEKDQHQDMEEINR